jgi:DNA-binding response OmpR family regulator
MPFRMSNILVVDDDPHIRELIRVFLQNEGFAVAESADGLTALAMLEKLKADLVILDVMMPNMDGWELCRELRANYDLPVLMLTAKGETAQKIKGFQLGADDYLVKPFALPELLARIRALLRRGRPSEVFRLKAADLEVDLVARRVVRGDRAIELTGREFDLLEYLLRHQGHLVSREMLARDVWKEPRRATPLDNVIDVQMTRLRRKVDLEGVPRLIHTVRGVGFVLREGEP